MVDCVLSSLSLPRLLLATGVPRPEAPAQEYGFLILVLLGLLLLVAGVLLWKSFRSAPGALKESQLRDELRLAREEAARQSRELREELAASQSQFSERSLQSMRLMGEDHKKVLIDSFQSQESRFNQLRTTLDEKLRLLGEDQQVQMSKLLDALKNQEAALRDEQTKGRDLLDSKLRQLQEGNERKLDQMRETVNEKLQKTLESRLTESFKIVSSQLESVQKGLGEMQGLADGVGDLKRLFGNVKARGTWGEYQLEAILSEILSPDQFEANVQTGEGRGSVEFAIKLPGKSEGDTVYLPIDSKFPRESYERLLDAAEKVDAAGVEEATKELIKAVTKMAEDIQKKYLNPPRTTDFAILFLPTESLYAEVLRQPGFQSKLQLSFQVVVTGPTTLAALLNSLRVGFRTLAIEKRSAEVWTILGAVRTEFKRFEDFLDKARKQALALSNSLERSSVRTRAMDRRLRLVEESPHQGTGEILGLEGELDDLSDEAGDDDASSDPRPN